MSTPDPRGNGVFDPNALAGLLESWARNYVAPTNPFAPVSAPAPGSVPATGNVPAPSGVSGPPSPGVLADAPGTSAVPGVSSVPSPAGFSALTSGPALGGVPALGNVPAPSGGSAPPSAGELAGPTGASPDAAPYFLPGADALGVEAEPRWDRIQSYEVEPAPGVTKSLASSGGLDPYAVRREFPILEEQVHGKRLVWLDNAATTQKPRAVIDRLSYFYEHENSNIHRAAHTLAARATDAYEGARESVRRFIKAGSVNEIVFVRGATEGINLIAQTYGRANVGAGDEILITWLEHHANIVPWQQLAAEKGARLRVAPVDDRGQVILPEFEKLLGPRTKLVALPQVSNALGTITPAHAMVALAHRHGARVLVDGAQSVSHAPTDVQALDADFFVFSGHKVFAPTGIGAVYAKSGLLADMPPWQGGGNMIKDVTFERTVYQEPPARFEAGTGSIADAAGLGAALDWLERLGIENVAAYEHDLLVYATDRLATVPGLTMIGTAHEKAGVLSFVIEGKRTEELGAALDREGIAVRSGHHCAQPILRRFGVESTVRASLAPYNVCEDIDALVDALHRLSR